MTEQVKFLEEENKRLRELYNDILEDNELLAKENMQLKKEVERLKITVFQKNSEKVAEKHG